MRDLPDADQSRRYADGNAEATVLNVQVRRSISELGLRRHRRDEYQELLVCEGKVGRVEYEYNKGII